MKIGLSFFIIFTFRLPVLITALFEYASHSGGFIPEFIRRSLGEGGGFRCARRLSSEALAKEDVPAAIIGICHPFLLLDRK